MLKKTFELFDAQVKLLKTNEEINMIMVGACELSNGSDFAKTTRVKQIEDNKGKTIVSEGIDANYQDMIN
jgi:hypothetical protein